ncbi:ATP-binding protein [Streptomyces sp. NBC_00370]|uniref:ATP-binding protein n=1 Tax=Streptomyces sp. NBC_00370 TaxID=2975728 RepID=UPI002E26F77E
MHHPHASDDRHLPSAERDSRPLLAAEARDAAYGFLAGLDPIPSTRTAQNLVLVVSELVTNALRHAGAVTSMRLRADRRSLQITVDDPSPAPPEDRVPDITGRDGGFGWPMIKMLAQKVTVLPGPGGGKTISAVLAR